MPFWTPLKLVVFFGAVILFLLVADVVAFRRGGFSWWRDGITAVVVLVLLWVFVAPLLFVPALRAGLIKSASPGQRAPVVKPQPQK